MITKTFVKCFITFLVLVSLVNCTTVNTIRLSPVDEPIAGESSDDESAGQEQLAEPEDTSPIRPKDVKIFRSTPIKESGYRASGMVVLNTTLLDLPGIYRKLRLEAARQGAPYIVDFKLKSKISDSYFTNDEGETVLVETRKYTASGTLLKPVGKSPSKKAK